MNRQEEEKIQRFWKENRIYEKLKERGKGKKKFYFLDGPPYATGHIHIGTALNKILKDVFIRFWRMQGFDVWDQPGYDTHGLPIENKVEKKLGIKSKQDIERLGIDKFNKECKKFATEFIDIMSSQFENVGVWMDWKIPYLTLSNKYIEGAWTTFKKGFEKGFLYHGLYTVHVCPHCETAVAYNEIEYKKLTDPSIYVKFKVKGKNEYLVIWTTTPWTLPSNTGVMVHPKAKYVRVKANNETLILAKELLGVVMDKLKCQDYEVVDTFLGKTLVGLEYDHPLSDSFPFINELEGAHRVVPSEQYVNMNEGTGLVHSAPGHGEEDYKIGKKEGLPIVCPLNMNGTYNKECGKYSGMFVKSADHEIIKELKEKGVLLHEEKITHDYPECWRCHSPLLQMAVPQWFFKVTDIRDDLLKENQKVNWIPKWGGQRFKNWLESLGDWPISRQRYWGIPLPIWRCQKCDNVKVIGTRDELPNPPEDLHRPYIDEVILDCECGGKMKRIEDVLDVWFDSGVASWATINYPKQTELFDEMWPADLNIEGSDQVRGWWNSQMITSMITFGKAPFKNILFHALILDVHGNKMSKSLGNIVTPEDVISKYGRDVLRFHLLSSPAWEDSYFNWLEAEALHKNFLVIQNSFRFVKMYVKDVKKPEKLNVEDLWMLSRLNTVIENITHYMKTYHAHKAEAELKDFLLNDFSRWYIKLIRDRTWPSYEGEDKEAAFFTLYEVTKIASRLLAPFCPFLSEHVHQDVLRPLGEKAESVHLTDWPKPNKEMTNEKLEKEMEIVQRIVETASAIRKEKGVKLRWPLNEISLETDNDLKVFEDVIKKMCNVKKVSYGKKGFASKEFEGGVVYLDTELTEELKEEALLREVMRKVQNIRKKMKLVVSDRIELVMSGCDVLSRFEDLMKKEVGAEKVVFKETDGEKLVFGDRVVKIKVKKV
jgi:isoleucyl-tRNA synthetase